MLLRLQEGHFERKSSIHMHRVDLKIQENWTGIPAKDIV